jgi:hypothetical protein
MPQSSWRGRGFVTARQAMTPPGGLLVAGSARVPDL